MTKGALSIRSVIRLKLIVALFSALNMAPLRLSYASALSIIFLDTLTVSLGYRSYRLCRIIIHKGDRATVSVDRMLYEICVEEEKKDGGRWSSLRQPRLKGVLGARSSAH